MRRAVFILLVLFLYCTSARAAIFHATRNWSVAAPGGRFGFIESEFITLRDEHVGWETILACGPLHVAVPFRAPVAVLLLCGVCGVVGWIAIVVASRFRRHALGGFTRMRILSSFLVLAALAAIAAERSHYTRDFALTLEPVVSQIRTGAVPSFRLTLTNISDHTCRVLNVDRRRDDLQHSYYDLVIWQDGKEIFVPRAISDPGPVSDADWVSIAPGATKTFLLKSFPQDLRSLRAGGYEATIRFWRDPHTSHSNAYDSPKTKFTVTQ